VEKDYPLERLGSVVRLINHRIDPSAGCHRSKVSYARS